MKKKFGLLFLVFCLLLALINVLVHAVGENAETLIIKGNGVSKELIFTRAYLESLNVGIANNTYSITNNFPTDKVVYKKGISLAYLLELAGIKDDARLIKITSTDGYSKTFTVNELIKDSRYYYASDGKITQVPVIIAFSESSIGYNTLVDSELMLTMGQRVKGEQNSPLLVKYLGKIEVSTAIPDQWPTVTFNKIVSSKGVTIVLKHPNYDSVKIFYTKNGLNPTMNSTIYNLSASYYQPELNKPIIITKNTEIRAFVVGAGKIDSAVASVAVSFDGSFSDLGKCPWAMVAIEELVKKGIVNGMGEFKFAPNNTLTRAQFAKMIVLALGKTPDSKIASTFSDVKISAWYSGYINKAVEIGLINGYTDGTFMPEKELSREEMLKIIITAMGVQVAAEKTNLDNLAPFAKETRISSWAREYVDYAEKFNLLEHGNMVKETAEGLSFNAIEKASRAEASVTIYRMLER
ncbi:MAG: S-layer homology domain-containing protein [Clostridia bacterium]